MKYEIQNCILNFTRTHRRTEAWTSPNQYAPSALPKLGALKRTLQK